MDDFVRARESQLAGSPWRRFLQSVPGQMLSCPPLYRLHRELLMKPEHRVLEIGCASGARLMVLDTRVRFTTTAAGVELSPRLARSAGTRFRAGARPLTAMLASPRALPFAGGVFDVAICGDMLRFTDLTGAQELLREAARVLKPGALLLAWDLAPAGDSRWRRFWRRRYDGRSASVKSLGALAERNGFAWARDAELRPFFWPPVPRVSFIASTLPPGWSKEGTNLIPPSRE